MAIWALVNDETLTVDNVESRTSNPPMVNGYRWIKDTDWAAGQTAAVNWLWDGRIPASFAEPIPVEPDPEGPSTQSEAIAAAEAKIAEATTLLMQARALG